MGKFGYGVGFIYVNGVVRGDECVNMGKFFIVKYLECFDCDFLYLFVGCIV